jgi:hypothetical protein
MLCLFSPMVGFSFDVQCELEKKKKKKNKHVEKIKEKARIELASLIRRVMILKLREIQLF